MDLLQFVPAEIINRLPPIQFKDWDQFIEYVVDNASNLVAKPIILMSNYETVFQQDPRLVLRFTSYSNKTSKARPAQLTMEIGSFGNTPPYPTYEEDAQKWDNLEAELMDKAIAQYQEVVAMLPGDVAVEFVSKRSVVEV